MMTQTHSEIIVEKAKSAGLEVVLDEGGALILGDEVFAGEFGYVYPSALPPYGVAVVVSFNGEQAKSAYKLVRGNMVGFFEGDDSREPDECLQAALRLIDYQAPSKRPIFILSGEDKTAEELADEAFEAVQKYRQAKGGEHEN